MPFRGTWVTSCDVPRREEAGPKDLQLQPRVKFGAVDMGAYEVQVTDD
jgi:hypothetical protein